MEFSETLYLIEEHTADEVLESPCLNLSDLRGKVVQRFKVWPLIHLA